MLSSIRNLVERVVIGKSASGLVRWGKHLPRPLIQGLQRDSFRELVCYAARRQKFLKRKLRENGIELEGVRRPEDLGNIFTTPEDLRNLPAEDFICRNHNWCLRPPAPPEAPSAFISLTMSWSSRPVTRPRRCGKTGCGRATG